MRCDRREASIAAGSVKRPSRPSSNPTQARVLLSVTGDLKVWVLSKVVRATAVRAQPARPLCGAAASAPHCLTYGRPAAAGGVGRAITPVTAISTRTYGRDWNRTDALPHGCASRMDSAVEPPNKSAAANAPNGRQLPKITAASAMKPRPLVIPSLKEP